MADGARRSVADRRPVGEDPALALPAAAAPTGRSASEPWRKVGESVEVKLFATEDKLYVLAKCEERRGERFWPG